MNVSNILLQELNTTKYVEKINLVLCSLGIDVTNLDIWFFVIFVQGSKSIDTSIRRK